MNKIEMVAGILTVAVFFGAALGTGNSQQSEIDKVKAANDAYYTALSARDHRAMSQVWSLSGDAVNIAPPIRPTAHVGWNAVKKNYEDFWGTLDQLTVSMEKPTIVVKGQVAWVYGIENAQRRTKAGETSGGPNIGTSIFVSEGGRWLMVFHQAALIPQRR